jgi:hypothetical protein
VKSARLAVQSVAKNNLRHETLPELMLLNDSATAAVEVPLVLTYDDLHHYRSKLGFETPLPLRRGDVCTGHIDFVQIRNGQVHILDYKPDAICIKPIEQLMIYALALARGLIQTRFIGDDQLWVFNFNEHLEADSDKFQYPPTALSRFCGAGKCPRGKRLGKPISPDKTGYATDTLDRVTGGAIGPSGAIVILNNWKKQGPRPLYYNTSPGGNSFVIVPGAAAPIKTPLIGPPRSFGERSM